MKRIFFWATFGLILTLVAYYFEEYRPNAELAAKQERLLGGDYSLSDLVEIRFLGGEGKIKVLKNDKASMGYLAPYIEYLTSFRVKRTLSDEEKRSLSQNSFFPVEKSVQFELVFKKENKDRVVQFTLGKRLSYDDLFYLKVKGVSEEWLVVQCLKPFDGIYQSEEDFNAAKYETLIQTFNNVPELKIP